jgi:hypothetical protein
MELIWFSGEQFLWCSLCSQNKQNLFVEFISFSEKKEIVCGVNWVLRTNIVSRVLVTKDGVRIGDLLTTYRP